MLIFIYLLVNIPVRVESQGAPDDEAKKTVLEEYIRQYRKLFIMSKKYNLLTIYWHLAFNRHAEYQAQKILTLVQLKYHRITVVCGGQRFETFDWYQFHNLG